MNTGGTCLKRPTSLAPRTQRAPSDSIRGDLGGLCARNSSIIKPLLLFALPAVLVAFSSAWQGRLLLDRYAVTTGGEIWRLWTGHWVHFSVSHLVWNLTVLFAAGAWLERVWPGVLLRHALVAVPVIGAAVLVFEPGLQAYGGLSGLATGVVVLLALHQWRTPGAERWLWAGVLSLVALKCAGDLWHLGPAFARYDEFTVRTSTTAHAAGAIVALVHHGLSRPQKAARAIRAGP
jgi:rhomboid family GlyGly-CTERM serine protease